MSRLSANEYPLVKIFSEQFFSIPHYQRPYAWGKDQAGQLLADVREAADHVGGAEPATSPYFLGSIVVVGARSAKPEYQVVDGQQRLTTLTLLLVSLARAINDTKFATGLRGLVAAAADPLSGTPARARVLLRAQERAFYEKHVVDGEALPAHQSAETLPDAQKRLWENLELFRTSLAEMQQETLERLAVYLAQGCFLVIVRTEDYDSAYRIFSVLNTRGLDLAPTDILKANLLGTLPEDQQQIVARRWEETEDRIGREPFVDLVSHVRTLILREKQKGTLTEEVLSSIVPKHPGGPRAFVDDLLGRFAEAFETLSDAQYQSSMGAEAVNRAIRNLSLLPNRDWVPTAMALYLSHGGDPKAFADALRLLERFAVSLAVRKKFFNERVERYKEVLRILAQPDGTPAIALALRPEEVASTRKALDGNVYEELQHIRMPLIRRISAAMTENQELESAQLMSVEHILPQNPPPGSEWMQWFPDPVERREWTHRLGNLVLLSRRRNAAAGNRPFAEKLATYFQAGNGHTTFGITIDVLGRVAFRPEDLAKRHAAIMSRVCREWDLDLPSPV
ncbi:DUF262 domain-containing HNH endonuclease family protein [Myxococcota bacterium]|nr:DUF262 domain-containing HNH endonuclease family protein [Myxococcota bacterium]